MDTLPPDARRLVDAALEARAEAEALEGRARTARAELGACIAALVRAGLPKRAVARLLGYASDNSVRAKSARHG